MLNELRRKLHVKSLVIATLVTRLIITAPIVTACTRELKIAAYRERGYNAVGGEWLAIGLIAAAVWALTGYIARLLLGIKK